MKFNITQSAFVEGLMKVNKVISSRSSLPILQGVYVKATEDEIVLTGSDANETIIHSIPVTGEDVVVEETGDTVFPKQVIDIVKKSRKHLSIDLDGTVTKIKSGKSEIELNCLDPEEYPSFVKVDEKEPDLVLDAAQFKTLVSKTSFAAAKTDVRPVLQGVYYNVTEDCMNLTCTDSHRLAVVKQKVESKQAIQMIIPASSLDNALKIFGMNGEIEIFSHSDNALVLKDGPTLYQTRLLDGNYPETSRLIPDSFTSVMKINRKEFLEGLELIKEVANSNTSNENGVAKIHVNGVASLSSTKAETGKGKIDIPYDSLEGEQEAFTISFSVKYAIDSLKALDCETVDFSFVADMRPFLLKPSDMTDMEECQLILPVRTV
ncbi:DNA polymerase III subunit beta [Halobacillus litoralis]|uniref:Beta sliding clamp n=1 Tax=Halobacillus litoralis TaxID=45668 RepID=A0A410MJD3_9BACI|nr:DNA polymerase III subunit beta [Halobacillus litoralis]QAS54788.1 DNA polymerase III subunit beta [Halobacillus litoralis]